jgi:hypothetical protein
VDTFKSVVALIVAVASLAATGVLIAFLFGKVGDENWDAYIYLLAGVEAISFAAAGWLFGKEVHREQAETAEEARKDAEANRVEAIGQAADEHRKGVEVGRAVLVEIEGTAATLATGAGADEARRVSGVLTRIIQGAYPELSNF